MSTFLKCAHQWYLGKVAGVPETPAVYLVAGNAVHAMIEQVNHELYREGLQGGSRN